MLNFLAIGQTFAEMRPFSILKITSVRHRNIQKFQIKEGQRVSPCKFHDNQSSDLSFLKYNGGRQPYELLINSKFYRPVGLISCLICVIVPTFMVIGQTIAEMR